MEELHKLVNLADLLHDELSNKGEGHLSSLPRVLKSKVLAARWHLKQLSPQELTESKIISSKQHWRPAVNGSALETKASMAFDGFAYFFYSAIESFDLIVRHLVKPRKVKTIHAKHGQEDWYEYLRLARNMVAHGSPIKQLPSRMSYRIEMGDRESKQTAMLNFAIPEKLEHIHKKMEDRIKREIPDSKLRNKEMRKLRKYLIWHVGPVGKDVPAYPKCQQLFEAAVRAVSLAASELLRCLQTN